MARGRPGRYHASLRLRPLTADEADRLLNKICVDEWHAGRAMQRRQREEVGTSNLAKLYRDARETAEQAARPVTRFRQISSFVSRADASPKAGPTSSGARRCTFELLKSEGTSPSTRCGSRLD